MRRRRTDDLAEKISQVADRLTIEANLTRQRDKRLAHSILGEAEQLQQYAHALDKRGRKRQPPKSRQASGQEPRTWVNEWS